jgi:hypothetical protein
MGIENLNRFHWIIIGALAGIAMAYAWANTGDNVEGITRAEPVYFERDVVQTDPVSKLPLITGIVIHPPEPSPADGCDVNLVTYKRLAKDKTGRIGWLNRWIIARIPYVPAIRGRVSLDPKTLTIQTYLAELAKTNDVVKFREGWWYVPKYAMMVGAAGGVLLIGGLWPTLLSVMSGAGLGPRRKTKEEREREKKDKALWRYKSRSEPHAPVGHQKPRVTAADQERLAKVAEAYEQSLKPTGMHVTPAGADTSAPQAEVRKLQSQTLEEAPKLPGQDDDTELKYKEYYPVVVHHHKHKDDKDHPKPGDEKKH